MKLVDVIEYGVDVAGLTAMCVAAMLAGAGVLWPTLTWLTGWVLLSVEFHREDAASEPGRQAPAAPERSTP